MRVIDIHVPDFNDFIDWIDQFPSKLSGFWTSWHLDVHTFPEDPYWYYVYIVVEGLRVNVIIHLDYDKGNQMCRIRIHSSDQKYEQDCVEY